MDYGIFFIFGLGSISLVVLLIVSLALWVKRHFLKRFAFALFLLNAFCLLVVGGWIYHAYILPDDLIQAAGSGNVEQVRILLNRDADPNSSVKDGTTATTLAAEGGHGAVVDVLKKSGGLDVRGE